MSVLQPRGEAVRDGVKIEWEYDPAAEVLEVECVHAPFWIDPVTVNSRLAREIESELDRAA